VPELLATNQGEIAVLVLDGEQLIGAKQNRTMGRSMILPAGKETRIPVSCMERGRWRYDSPDFRPSPQNSPTSVRRKARDLEAGHARRGFAPEQSILASAQFEVWKSIADFSAKLGAHSPTDALDEVFASKGTEISTWLASFHHEPGQLGLLAFLGDQPLGMDVIGAAKLYARLHDRLLRGYVLDAMVVDPPTREPSTERAGTYLQAVNAAHRVQAPTAGDGRYAVLEGMVVGGELTWEDRIVHLSAFPSNDHGLDEEARDQGDPILPPSRRRRRM
jgi:hypothetical protein